MSDFHAFSKAVKARLDSLLVSGDPILEVDIPDITQVYLDAFPEGSDPIYITNTEHDCTCCNHFLRNIGGLIALRTDGARATIWDTEGLPYPYDVVAAKLNAAVQVAPIRGVFVRELNYYGKEETKQTLDDGRVVNWNHFHGNVIDLVSGGESEGHVRNEAKVDYELLKKGMTLSDYAFTTVIDLIKNNGLYRGEEKLATISKLAEHKAHYDALETEQERVAFLWRNRKSWVARASNSSIGVLLSDLSEGVDLEKAVMSYEKIVAGDNYKRSKSIITAAMVESAQAKLTTLGLGDDSYKFRHTTLDEVGINNLIWVNGAKQEKKTGLNSLLAGQIAKRSVAKATNRQIPKEAISMDEFVESILPEALDVKIKLKNSHTANLAVVTKQVDTNAKILKWDNGFSWTYAGGATDVVRERVKAAGGNVDAPFRVSLAWNNIDDLDLHALVFEENNSRRIAHVHYGDKKGILDVDANSPMTAKTETPVENMSFVNFSRFTGRIDFIVHNFQSRTSVNKGFTLQVFNKGVTENYEYDKALGGKAQCLAYSIDLFNGAITAVRAGKELKASSNSSDKWGVSAGEFITVNAVMPSPNYWGEEGSGNRHWFFALEGAKADEKVRGFFNEYLRSELHEHRKVFEVLGDSTKIEPSDNQLCVAGFSSTLSEEVTLQVTKADGSVKIHNVVI